jgi:FkbM family methyltransferase
MNDQTNDSTLHNEQNRAYMADNIIDCTTTYKFLNWMIDTHLWGSRKLARVLSKLLIPPLKQPSLIVTHDGLKVEVYPYADMKGVEHDLYYKGTYEKGTLHFIKTFLNGEGNFLDIGANIGYMTLYAANLLLGKGKVHAVEANPDTRALLERNIKHNNLSNVIIHPYGLGAANDKLLLYKDVAEQNRGAASFDELAVAGDKSQTVEVEVKMLDNIPIEEKINLIKIDVEGWELEVLKGGVHFLKEQDFPAIIWECCLERIGRKGSPVDIFDFLKAFGKYRFYKFSHGKERISSLKEFSQADELPFHDNVICLKK